MKLFVGVVTFFALVAAAAPAGAQVYVFGREDKMEAEYSANQEEGGAKVLARVAKKEGKWFSLLQSDVAGYGALYAVCDDGGLNPEYALVEGKASAKEAHDGAKAKLAPKKRGSPIVLKSWNNTNKFPIKRVTTR